MTKCGNPYLYDKETNFDQCSALGDKGATIYLTVVPVVSFLLALLVSYVCLRKIAFKVSLQYDVKWHKKYAFKYFKAAHSVYGKYLAIKNNGLVMDITKSSRHLGVSKNITVDLANVYLKKLNNLPLHIPVCTSYMHARLRTHLLSSIINFSWAVSNIIMVIVTLIVDARAGEYWRYIGVVFVVLITVHLSLVVYANFIIVPILFKSGLRRSLFENYRRFGLTFLDGDKHHPISYLDQYEQEKGDLSHLTELEKALFTKSYNDAVRSSKLVQKSQDSLLSGAGSSVISALLLIASSLKALDVNGTVPSINALSLTFAIAATAQAVAAVTDLGNATISSRSATEGIEQINIVWKNMNSSEWVEKAFAQLSKFRIWGVAETPVFLSDSLNQHYYNDCSPYVKTEHTISVNSIVGMQRESIRQELNK